MDAFAFGSDSKNGMGSEKQSEKNRGGGEEGEVAKLKYGRHQEHLARLLVKVAKRGIDIVDQYGDQELWRMRWLD